MSLERLLNHRSALARLAVLACLAALPLWSADQPGTCCGGAPMTVTVSHHATAGGPVLRAITTVQTIDFSFSAKTITVAVGDTVTWSNSSGTTHTSTSDTGVWNSGDIVSGTSYSRVFSTAGTFPYHCFYHAAAYGMTGTVVVLAAPPITSPASATASLGSPFTYQIVAVTATSYNATGLPSGLTVDTATGAIAGTPTASGPFSVSLTASNAGGPSTATLALTVDAPAAGSPAITSAATASGTAGSAFLYTITATNTPTSFAASRLPAGLIVNGSTGAITGTPSAAGTSDAAITATNASGSSTTTITVVINAAAAGTSSSSGGSSGTGGYSASASGGCGLGGGSAVVLVGGGLLLWRRSTRRP